MWISKKKWDNLNFEVMAQKGALIRISKTLGTECHDSAEKGEISTVVGLLQEAAKKAILELKGALEQTPITPDSQTYIQIYEAAKSLYFCQKYKLAAEISWALKMELTKEN